MPKVSNGAVGTGFFSAIIRSISVWLTALAEEIIRIVVFLVNNSSLYAILSALVL